MLKLRDLSIHGNSYIFRQDLHILERIFWVIIVIGSLIFSIYISLGEWDKFRNNPTALFIETDYRRFNFEHPGISICAMGINDSLIKEVLMKNFSLNDVSNPKYEFYSEYLRVIASTNYTNFEKYERFVNDTMIKKTDFVKIATEINYRSFLQPKSDLSVSFVLSELGGCFTTSRIFNVMDPFKGCVNLFNC